MKRRSDRWTHLWTRLQADANLRDAIFDELVAAYADPSRHYHNLDHIDQMFDILDRVESQVSDLDAIELAIWFHDFVYDPTAADNEERSAQVAGKLLASAGIETTLIDRVKTLILQTKTHNAPVDDSDGQLLLDIDLAILGASPDSYHEYAAEIRREYAMFSDDVYRDGRCRVLDSLLKRPRLYATESLFSWFEKNARKNVQAELYELQQSQCHARLYTRD